MLHKLGKLLGKVIAVHDDTVDIETQFPTAIQYTNVPVCEGIGADLGDMVTLEFINAGAVPLVSGRVTGAAIAEYYERGRPELTKLQEPRSVNYQQAAAPPKVAKEQTPQAIKQTISERYLSGKTQSGLYGLFGVEDAAARVMQERTLEQQLREATGITTGAELNDLLAALRKIGSRRSHVTKDGGTSTFELP